MEHHNLDTHPLPKDKSPIYINEPWLIDNSLQWRQPNGYSPEPLDDADNVRVYVPLDLCKEAILRRLREVIDQRGAVTEKNESDYRYDVITLINQIEIYDQVWFIRHMPKQGKHSVEAIELVKDFVAILEDMEVYDAEIFPYSTIEKLRKEFIETIRDKNEPMEYGGDWY